MKGSVYFREKDQRWVGAIDLGKDESGKRKRKTVYGNSEKEVQRKVNNIIYEVQNNLYRDSTNQTFISFLNDYHDVFKPKWEPTTASLYKMYIDVHFKPYFKDIKLEAIKPITLDKFYNYKLENKDKRKTPLSSNSVRKLHIFIKSALNYAVKNNLILTNPANNVTPPKKEKFIPVIYEEHQFLQLLDYVKDKYDRVPIILGAAMGLRRGEVFGLTWKDIDFKNKTITIDKSNVRFDKDLNKAPKNESSKRTIAGPNYVFEILKEYKKETNPKSNRENILNVKPSYYSHRFKWLLEKFEMQPIRFHDLRHYNAVVMMKMGVPDKVAAERLGHAQVSTLREVYQHVQTDMDKEVANKLNDMFEKKI